MNTRFEWDAVKAEGNLRKHGVTFETAIRVFVDPLAVQEQDRVENGEQRWRTIGVVGRLAAIIVAHTSRFEEEGDKVVEIIRIISARVAEPKERRRYEGATRQV